MTEAIYKLQPDRTIHLQGFDGYGCTAALWGTSGSGFTISGVWGEQSDFAVLVLWDADNQFEHPRLRYLPDTAFDGIALAFDLAASNCVQIDSDLFPWIDWAYLNVTFADGTGQQVRLSDHATQASGYLPATIQFELQGTPTLHDFVELAWLDQHFNYRFELPTNTLADAANSIVYGINTASPPTGVTASLLTETTIKLTYNGVGGSLLGKGLNGNRIGVYGSVHGVGTESWAPASGLFAGGITPGMSTWHVALDFSTMLGQTEVRRMWLTFAPPIPIGAAFAGGEFSIAVTNWVVTDASGRRLLQVAGPGSVRLEDSDAWVVRAGYWEDPSRVAIRSPGVLVNPFWSGGRAIRSGYNSTQTRKLTIETHCQSTHDIYLGTYLDSDCGQVSATLDGGAPVTLDCHGGGVLVRRRLFSGAAAGQHSVTITILSTKNALSGGWYFYFDFLECAVRTGVADALVAMANSSPAIDYDTDHGYKLSPQRLIHLFDKLGFTGPMNEYIGVFWWPVRKMLTAATTWSQTSVVTFSGPPAFGRRTYLNVAGTLLIDHLNLIGDTAETVALAIALRVNQGSTVFWASVSGAVLTLQGLAGGSGYHLAVTIDTHDTGFTAAVVETNTSAVAVEWGVDDAASTVVNSAAKLWHADLYQEVQARGRSITTAFSMELVNPPGPWAARFVDGVAVTTSTGFGALVSTHCATGNPSFLAYQQAAFLEIAGLQATAGLTPEVQCGEFLWWFFNNVSGMAYYDAATAAAAAIALGHPLHSFLTPDDDPSLYAADTLFLRNRLRDHVAAIAASVRAAHGAAKIEVLYPYDVNYPSVYGPNRLGGRLNVYVNLPAEWKTKAGSGLDRMKIEALDFGSSTHSLDLARQAIRLPIGWGWPLDSIRYLFPVMNGGCPFLWEQQIAAGESVPYVTPFAMDHVCLLGWDLGQVLVPRAVIF